ncbi:hypothetical protein E2C01_047517 [Portunus trituberculatus]|uniref:Uncharacterized protein n=1 Tax=Portunus trituberculatus TaxID=210409 RepID=A0A5B7G844_PORTR|nr:hypothetical protein [Portunus trituberculatus]
MDEGQLCPPSRDLALPLLLVVLGGASLHTLTQNPTKTTTLPSLIHASTGRPHQPSLPVPFTLGCLGLWRWLPFPSPFATRISSHFIPWLDEPLTVSPLGSTTLIPIPPSLSPFVSLDALQNHNRRETSAAACQDSGPCTRGCRAGEAGWRACLSCGNITL